MSTRLSEIPTEILATILYGQANRLDFDYNIAPNAPYSSGPVNKTSPFITRKRGDKTIADDRTLLEPIYGTTAYGEPVKRVVISRKTLKIKQNPQQVYWKPVIAPEIGTSDEQEDGLVQLIQSWIDEGDTDEQQETLEYLIHALDEDRLSNRKLFPKELKGKSW